MEVRVLNATDAADFQSLRLEALRESPTAFTSSYEEERATPLARVAERLAPTPNGVVLGAFEEGVLIGLTGIYRERLRKLAHKGVVWGVYVAPAFRNRGIGRRLLTEAIRQAAAMPGLKQLNLSANAANPGALALYESMGFERFGFERACMWVDGEPYDEIQMSRSVSTPGAPR